MKEITLVLDSGLIAQLGLEPTASAADIGAKVKSVLEKGKRVDDLKAQLQTAEAEKTAAEQKLEALRAEASEKEIAAELDAAVADGRTTEEERKLLEKDYAGKPDALKAVLKTRTPRQAITAQLKGGEQKTELDELAAKSYDELWRANKLDRLKALAPEVFEAKKAERFKK